MYDQSSRLFSIGEQAISPTNKAEEVVVMGTTTHEEDESADSEVCVCVCMCVCSLAVSYLHVKW